MSYNVTISGTEYDGISSVKLKLTDDNGYKMFGDAEGIADGSITSFESDTVKEIKRYTFMGCKKLTTVNCPNLKTIGIGAFDTCDALTTIDLSNVEGINNTAFYGCKSLSGEINLPKLINPLGQNCFQNCTGITKVVMPIVRGAGKGMFNGCSSLKIVDLGSVIGSSNDNTSVINSQAFVNTPALEAVIIRTTSCVVYLSLTDVFINSGVANGTGYIYVPSALVDSYKSANNWSTFASQIRAIEDYPDICG